MITDHLLEGSPMKLKNPVALVTGASSGIGKATAERLATAGYKVYGTSRRGATSGQRAFEMLSLDANLLQPDATLDEYREARAAVAKRMTEMLAAGDQPDVVADAVLKAATATHPKVRYAAGAPAIRLRLLRRFAPVGTVDAGIRKTLRLDALTESLPHRRGPGQIVDLAVDDRLGQ